ncbi:MAG: hypothetical protein ACKVZJ_10350 [Phycisphaerales bacterium]
MITSPLISLTLAETAVEHAGTPSWQVVMFALGLLASLAFSVAGWLNTRAEKSEDRSDETAKENVRLGRDLLLARIDSIGERMKSDQAEMRAEMKAALTAIQASVTRHDNDIEQLSRQMHAFNDWRIALEAVRAADVKGGQHG